MTESPRVTALVPMKGHSQRVPRKNLRPLNGIPLYHWIVRALLDTERVNEVVIETDSDEIESDVRQNFDLRVLRRPPELVGDEIPMNDLIAFHISQINSDIYLQTHATNPLLLASTIDKSIHTFHRFGDNFDSLFSVTPIQSRLYFSDGQPVNHDPAELLPTQRLPLIYEENSNLYVFTAKSFRKHGRRIGEKPYMFEMDPLEATDIDNMNDFHLAETLMRLRYES